MEIPQLWLNWFSIIMGLITGSFLNVVIYRLPEGQSIVTPRSSCPHCSSPIAWRDNIPVLSYLLLRGQCRHCKGRISVRYPVIELLTGILFLTALLKFGMSPLLVLRDWPFIALLISITFIDLDHRLILDKLSFPGIAHGILTSYWVPEITLIESIGGAVLGYSLFYGLAWAYEKASGGKQGLGGGDVKLLAMVGAYLGPQGVITTILISSVLGSIIGLVWGRLQGSSDLLKTSIPYGPFLVLGALYFYLFGPIVLM